MAPTEDSLVPGSTPLLGWIPRTKGESAAADQGSQTCPGAPPLLRPFQLSPKKQRRRGMQCVLSPPGGRADQLAGRGQQRPRRAPAGPGQPQRGTGAAEAGQPPPPPSLSRPARLPRARLQAEALGSRGEGGRRPLALPVPPRRRRGLAGESRSCGHGAAVKAPVQAARLKASRCGAMRSSGDSALPPPSFAAGLKRGCRGGGRGGGEDGPGVGGGEGRRGLGTGETPVQRERGRPAGIPRAVQQILLAFIHCGGS